MKNCLVIVFGLGIFFLTNIPNVQCQTNAYEALPLGSVKPNGWLRNQLKIMLNGTTGHLDEVYDKISNDNGWLGGKGDGWEETLYWLDGAVPLAWLLDDAVLKAKVKRYIDWMLDHQRPSGYFGPITKSERENKVAIASTNCEDGEDWWPKMVALKVLQQYYTATKDERVIPFMEKFFSYQLKSLTQCPLKKWSTWAESRGAENAMIILWLYSINRDPKLIELAKRIQSQSFPWTRWLGNRTWVIRAAAYQDNVDWMSRHGVNVAMGLKSPLIDYKLYGNKNTLDSLLTGFTDLMTLHGLPMGIFSSDEDLHGNAPTQGAELCAIVEAMFSLEQAVLVTGNTQYVDALERMTFNALPAQTTDDYNARQYYQIANQVQVTKGAFDFTLPFYREMCHVFGMKSGYTCCLANMHQGWTKFAAQLWLRSADGGLAALSYSPSTVTTTVGENQQQITIDQKTSYPFSDRITMHFATEKPIAFPLHLRLPVWCKQAVVTLNGEKIQTYVEGGQIIVLKHQWKNGDQLELHFPMEIHVSTWGRNSRAVEKGPLVYALKLAERWEKGTDEKEGTYFSVYPEGKWNYGLLEEAIKSPASYFTVYEKKIVDSDFIWNQSHAPVEIKTKAREIVNWKLIDGVARQPVSERKGMYKGELGKETEEITLIPYGCTKVRVVAFPVAWTINNPSNK